MHTPPNPQHLLALPVLLLSLTLLLIGIWHFGFIPVVLGTIGLHAALVLWVHTSSPDTTSRATFQ